jgi:hypothetical protein
MKELQNVSKVVWIQVQVLANDVNVKTVYSKYNAIFDMLWTVHSINETHTSTGWNALVGLKLLYIKLIYLQFGEMLNFLYEKNCQGKNIKTI